MRVAAVAWFAASCLSVSPLAAQSAPVAAPAFARGERVRLRLLDGASAPGGGRKLRGTIGSASPETIELFPPGGSTAPITLKLSQVAKLEVVRGKRTRWREGAAIGFVPGALFGGGAAYVLSCDADPPESCSAGSALAGALIVGAGTAGVGALIGLAIKTDRWIEVPTRKPQLRLSLVPVRSGLRASLSVRY